MKIIIDAMGGDNAPLAPLMGAAQSVEELGVSVVLVGDEPQLKQLAQQNNVDMKEITIRHASDVIAMDEDATDILRKKPDSSMAVALKMLANGEGDALVSAGSTGALLVGATLIVKRIKGIKRAAIGGILPGSEKPWLLIDSGANVECRPEMLVQFGAMGSAYMEKVMGIPNPVVALANNGTEETKGTPLQLEAFPLLQKSGLNFSGNIEARNIPLSGADVIVCDGFTGNIILKQSEGMGKMISGLVKEMFTKNLKTKFAALLLMNDLKNFKKKMDYKEYGGAPLLGIKKTVIKAHGSSDALAIKSSVRQAKICVENNVESTIEEWLTQHKEKQSHE